MLSQSLRLTIPRRQYGQMHCQRDPRFCSLVSRLPPEILKVRCAANLPCRCSSWMRSSGTWKAFRSCLRARLTGAASRSTYMFRIRLKLSAKLMLSNSELTWRDFLLNGILRILLTTSGPAGTGNARTTGFTTSGEGANVAVAGGDKTDLAPASDPLSSCSTMVADEELVSASCSSRGRTDFWFLSAVAELVHALPTIARSADSTEVEACIPSREQELPEPAILT
jgi:hypothetical protein